MFPVQFVTFARSSRRAAKGLRAAVRQAASARPVSLLAVPAALWTLTLFGCGSGTSGTPAGAPGGAPPSDSLIISGLTANTTIAKNGAFVGTAHADNFGGQYSFAIIKDPKASPVTEFSGDIFVTSPKVGQTIDLANAAQGNLAYQESGSLFYLATSGTESIDAVSSTSISITFHNARFQPQAGGTGPGATGEFTLNGTVTAPVTNH